MELHGTTSQMLDGLEELVEALRMLGTRSPQTKAVHEAHVPGLGDGCGRAIDDAGLGEAGLQLHDGGGRLRALGLVLLVELGLAILIELDILGLQHWRDEGNKCWWWVRGHIEIPMQPIQLQRTSKSNMSISAIPATALLPCGTRRA